MENLHGVLLGGTHGGADGGRGSCEEGRRRRVHVDDTKGINRRGPMVRNQNDSLEDRALTARGQGSLMQATRANTSYKTVVGAAEKVVDHSGEKETPPPPRKLSTILLTPEEGAVREEVVSRHDRKSRTFRARDNFPTPSHALSGRKRPRGSPGSCPKYGRCLRETH